MPLPEPPDPGIKSRDRHDPLAEIGDGQGHYYTREELTQIQEWQQARLKVLALNEREKWEQSEHGKLCLEIYQKFQEYKKMLEANPQLCPNDWNGRVDYPEHELFVEALKQTTDYHRQCAERDRMNLEKARLAERCEHEFLHGERCGSPKMKGEQLCYMHLQMKKADAVKVELGALEDAESVQLAIKRMLKALVDGTLDQKIVVQMTNLLQIAAWNVTRTRTGMRAMEEAAVSN